MAKLIFVDKAWDGRVYELTGEKTTVGRSSDNTLAIRDSSISGKHCEILVYGPEVIVRDLGSRNGTFVNGKRLANEQWQLKAGQIVRFGSVKARLEMDEPVSEDFDTLSLAEIEKFITEEKRPAAPDAHVVLAGESPPAETAHTIHLAAPSLAEGKESQTGSSRPGPDPTDGGAKRTKPGLALGAAMLLGLLLWLVWKLGLGSGRFHEHAL